MSELNWPQIGDYTEDISGEIMRLLSDLLPVMEPPRASTRKLTRKSVLMGLSCLPSALEGLAGLMLAVNGGGGGHCWCFSAIVIIVIVMRCPTRL